MNILNDHNFKCNFPTLNVFTFFLKTETKQVLTLPRSQCISGEWVLTGCTPTAFHTEAPVPRSHRPSGSCLFQVRRTSLTRKETFLPLGVINVSTLNPDTKHETTRTRTLHHGQVCHSLPQHLGYFHFEELALLSILPTEKHELFCTDFGKDSLRKTNYNVGCLSNEMD